jgi:hypothetical protein
MIDKAVITCGLQDSEPRDGEAQSRASHELRFRARTRQADTDLRNLTGSSVQLLRPHLSHPAMSNRHAIPFEKTGIQYSIHTNYAFFSTVNSLITPPMARYRDMTLFQIISL